MRISEFIEGKIKEAGAKQGLRILEAIKKNPSIAMKENIVIPGLWKKTLFLDDSDIKNSESALLRARKGIDPELAKSAKGKAFNSRENEKLLSEVSVLRNATRFRSYDGLDLFKDTKYNTELLKLKRDLNPLKKTLASSTSTIKNIESK